MEDVLKKYRRDIQILKSEYEEWDSIFRCTSIPHTKKQAQTQMEELKSKIEELQSKIGEQR